MRLQHLVITTAAAIALSATAAPPAPVRVLIAPVQVQFDRAWLEQMNRGMRLADRVRDEDARRIARDMAASLEDALGAAARTRGLEVVQSPSDGVVRLSARIDDLYLNAPDVGTAMPTKSFVRDAGHATLRMEGREVTTGAVRVQAEHRGTAGDTGAFSRATRVTNQFWFDAMFRHWAQGVVAELGSDPQR